MKKRLLVLSLALIFICNVSVCYSASKVTMYSLDGRQLNVWDYEVEAYKKVGWYTQPMTKMYALDGRTMIVPTSYVDECSKVGWYTELPRVTMYALDGRQISILSSEVDAYKNVGWYTAPVVKIYGANGKTAIVYESELYSYLNNGWNTSPILTKSAFLNKVNGWWVDLSNCGRPLGPGESLLPFVRFTAKDIEVGAIASEGFSCEMKSLEYVGNGIYRALIYAPGYYYGEYFEPKYYNWLIDYDGGETLGICFDNDWNYYTFFGKNHTYDSIQRDWRVVEAMNW